MSEPTPSEEATSIEPYEAIIEEAEVDDGTTTTYTFDEDLPTATFATTVGDQVKQIMLGAAVECAERIIDVARGNARQYSRLELDAARYVIEYGLGDPKLMAGKGDSWDSYLAEIMAGEEKKAKTKKRGRDDD